MSLDCIFPLDTPDATLEVAGGKGVNLSRLACAGFAVPPGFVIGTAAYRAFIQANQLEQQIAEAARAVRVDAPASSEAASQVIRQLFVDGAVSEAVASAIGRAYRNLSSAAPVQSEPTAGLAVAVRSSATAEDLPGASFAGQQETYLNVRGEVALLAAVKRCWSSLWTARAIAYRARHGIDPATVGLAVVVQQMVPADAAGVLFTVNPVTGDRSETVVDAAWGLGEAIVAGRVSPDTVVVDKATGRVKHASVGDKSVMTAATAAGTAEVAVAAERRLQPVLTPEQAAELNRLGRAVEDHFGVAQDVEWAIASGRVYVLQARPVTSLPPAPPASTPTEPTAPGDDDWPVDSGPQPSVGAARSFDLWTQSDVGERWPEPVTPLTWSSTPLSIDANLRHSLRGLKAPYIEGIRWAKRRYGRVYFNEGALVYVFTKEHGMPASWLASLFDSPGRVYPESEPRFRLLPFLRGLPLMLRLSGERTKNERIYQDRFPEIDRWVAAFMARDLGPTSDAALWEELWSVWTRRLVDTVNLHADASSSATTALPSLSWLLQRWLGRKELAHDLVVGLSGIITAEIPHALAAMARQVRELGLASVVLENSPAGALGRLRATPAAKALLATLDDFLARHGHRCPGEAEWLRPRWVEAPEQVIAAIAGYLRSSDPIDPNEAEAKQRRRREEAVARVEARLDPVRRRILMGMLAWTQHLVRLRDNGQHFVVKLLLPWRRIVATLGERWAARGWLGQADDIFFLTLPEVEQIVKAGNPSTIGKDLAALVAGRRRAWQFWFTVTAPEAIGPDGRPVTATVPSDASGTVLVGIAVSGGRARGTARIIADPAEGERLRTGDILVTRSTDPGWTPLFPLVGGLVLEVGGQLSHGAIVAREYGLPAVVNVADATRRIRDGQLVEVDGTSGRVYVLAASGQTARP